MRSIIVVAFIFLLSTKINAQGCCSGGSGSPIAGGASQGVLQDRQMEVAANYQYIKTDTFKVGDRDTARMFDNFRSDYLYFKVAYGITKDFTLSVETGYFLNKTQIGLDHIDTSKSKGIGDLIIFPRYDVLNHTEEKKRTEITLGLGYKIPLGSYNDSFIVYRNPQNGHASYTTSSPAIQATSGANDFIFYGFFFRGFPQKNFRLFANVLYVKKGFNPLGEKMGDYSSIGLFAGKTFFKKFGLTLQVKAEHINKMQAAHNLDLLALYGVDINATGSRKIFFVPQLSYTYKNFTVFALSEIPLYKYVNYAQVASRLQITCGMSYRFFTYKSGVVKPSDQTGTAAYYCPMHPEETSTVPAKCPKCGMDMEKKQ